MRNVNTKPNRARYFRRTYRLKSWLGMLVLSGAPVVITECTTPAHSPTIPKDGLEATSPIVPVRSCPDGAVRINGATFRFQGELVTVGSFCMDRFEATCGAYADCIVARACSPIPQFPWEGLEIDASAESQTAVSRTAGLRKDYWAERDDRSKMIPNSNCDPVDLSPTRASHPMVCVTLDDARALCSFRHGRVPTIEEWQLAARGPGRTLFPWGNSVGKSVAPSYPDSAVVGSYPDDTSAEGVHDLLGSVLELATPGNSVPRSWDDRARAWHPAPERYLPNPAVWEEGVTVPGNSRDLDRGIAGGFDSEIVGEPQRPCDLCQGASIQALRRSRDTGFRCVYP